MGNRKYIQNMQELYRVRKWKIKIPDKKNGFKFQLFFMKKMIILEALWMQPNSTRITFENSRLISVSLFCAKCTPSMFLKNVFDNCVIAVPSVELFDE